MSRRVPIRRDLGEAISLEDALSVMVVIFVLFVLIMVPLINIDKIRLAKSEKDQSLIERVQWLSQQEANPEVLKPYLATFSMYSTEFQHASQKDNLQLLEFFTKEDSTLTIIQHNLKAGEFTMMQSIGLSKEAVFRQGRLVWSPGEKEWFTAADAIIPSKSNSALKMYNSYQKWMNQIEVSP